MTGQGMIDWFKIVQDMYGSPYFTDSEYLNFLNRAQFDYVSKMLPSVEGVGVNVEQDWNKLQNVSTLLYELPATTMSASGIIADSAIGASLATASGDVNADFYTYLSIEYKKGVKRFPCKVLRHNDKAEFETNYFKRPGQYNPRYLIQNNGIQFRPIDVNTQIYITVLKTPRDISLVVDSELPITAHNEIVALGLQFAGIASRDEVLSQLNRVQLPQ